MFKNKIKIPIKICGVSPLKLTEFFRHSSIHMDKDLNEFILVTSYTNTTAFTFR